MTATIKGKKAQGLSLDLLIAVLLFLGIIGAFYYISLHKGPTQQEVEELKVDTLKLTTQLDYQGDIGILDEYRNLNIDKVNQLYNKTPEEIRNELGLRGKFCIYITDSQGNVLIFNNKTGVGYSDVVVGGTPCGEEVTSSGPPTP